MIQKIDATIPRGNDLGPGMPGNRCAENEREVRAKINEIIDVVNNNNECQECVRLRAMLNALLIPTFRIDK
jgi:hypothetical protein